MGYPGVPPLGTSGFPSEKWSFSLWERVFPLGGLQRFEKKIKFFFGQILGLRYTDHVLKNMTLKKVSNKQPF